MEMAKQLIHQRQYDLLIILDACRYDVFSEVYGEFLFGTLRKVEAAAGDTIHWCKKVWREWYDVTYFSANPIINSRLPVAQFEAAKHFRRIVDVWNAGWDHTLGTVPPERVNVLYRPTGSIDIVHYMQPHGPWIGETPLSLTKPAERRVPGGLVWPDAEVIRDNLISGSVSDEYLRHAYRDNLRLVLSAVRRVIRDSGRLRVIVSTDHGELLGEHDRYLHHQKYLRYPEVSEIPWFMVGGIS